MGLPPPDAPNPAARRRDSTVPSLISPLFQRNPHPPNLSKVTKQPWLIPLSF